MDGFNISEYRPEVLTPSIWTINHVRMRLFSALLFAIVVSSCRSAPAEDAGAVAQKMFDAFNNHQWSAMADAYDSTALFLDPSLGQAYVHQSHAQIEAKYAGMHKMFPDIHDEITGMYVAGDKVTVEFISTGRMNDSVSFTLPIVSVLTVQHGKIIRDATYYDLENP
jgi:ketosteroid isomerase-like protein